MKTLIATVLCAAASALQPAGPLSHRSHAPPQFITRRAAVETAASALLLASLPAFAADGEPVMKGVLQMQPAVAQKIPAGSVATVAIRVVGRNTKGPLGTLQLPLDGRTFPIDYTVERNDLREGVPDFVWVDDDIYVFSEITAPSGKKYAEGRSKAKMKPEGRQIAYLTLE